MGVQAEAQLENLCQAHILLGCPVGGGGMGREEVNRVQPGTQHPNSMPSGQHCIQCKIQSRGGELSCPPWPETAVGLGRGDQKRAGRTV